MIEINGTRLWKSLMEMAEIGATDKGGSRRLALTDLDRQGRDLFQSWCKEIGCTVSIDEMGNIFARREGRNPNLPPVQAGSHLDTQPTGGKFDGVYGVLGALEVLRTLHDHNHSTDSPLEAICWTNEEGARFSPAMIGSGVWAGIFDLEFGHTRADPEGMTIREELERIGYLGARPCRQTDVKAYYEIHIEQGPVLEAESKTVGIVTGGQGCNWYHLRLHGMASHAGTTPMAYRRDALHGAARIVSELREEVLQQENALVTVGTLNLQHDSINTIPGEVFFTIDMRHPVPAVLSGLDQNLRNLVEKVCREEKLEPEINLIWEAPTVTFDQECVGNVRDAAKSLGYSCQEIVSGAGHDACQMSHVVPTGMIFIPCKDGVSHNEIESAEPEHITSGANVLLHAMLKSAN